MYREQRVALWELVEATGGIIHHFVGERCSLSLPSSDSLPRTITRQDRLVGRQISTGKHTECFGPAAHAHRGRPVVDVE